MMQLTSSTCSRSSHEKRQGSPHRLSSDKKRSTISLFVIGTMTGIPPKSRNSANRKMLSCRIAKHGRVMYYLAIHYSSSPRDGTLDGRILLTFAVVHSADRNPFKPSSHFLRIPHLRSASRMRSACRLPEPRLPFDPTAAPLWSLDPCTLQHFSRGRYCV